MRTESSASRRVERFKLSSQVYERVRNDILRGQLAPGTPISEEALAETYGVSRSPTREAIAELERVGLAERSGLRDRKVTTLSLDKIRDKFELWWIVDVGRTYLASLTASKKDIAELNRFVEDMDASVHRNDVSSYKNACERFHKKIRRGCQNKAVNQVGRDCDTHLDWFENLYDRNPEYSIAVVEEHRFILNAFERQDLADLSESIRNHIWRQRDRILRHFEDFEMEQRSEATSSDEAQVPRITEELGRRRK